MEVNYQLVIFYLFRNIHTYTRKSFSQFSNIFPHLLFYSISFAVSLQTVPPTHNLQLNNL